MGKWVVFQEQVANFDASESFLSEYELSQLLAHLFNE